MKRTFVATFALALTFLSFPKAFADKFNSEIASEARSLGMGNAGINVSRGPFSVFYNPANIAAKETGTNIQLVNLQLDVSDGLLAQGLTGAYKFISLSSLYGALKESPGTYAGGRFSVYPNVTLRNFSLGILYETNQGAMVRASDNALRVKARNRFAPTGAMSFRLLSGILRFGASASLLTVGNADRTILPPVPGSLDYKSSINSASGLVMNGGLTVTLPLSYLPSFSLVARNIGGTRFAGPALIKWGAGKDVPTQPMTFDFGSSISVYLARRLEMKIALDYRDISNQLEGSALRHVFTGTELIFHDFFRLRGGLAHGYLSYGFGINTPKASLDISVYTDEFDDKLRGTQEQRYVLQYTWGFFK